MSEYRTFTSESVSEGHPDKLADQVSDAVLDALLSRQPRARVAVETMIKDDLVVVGGEIGNIAAAEVPNIHSLVSEVVTSAGYDREEVGLDGSKCKVLTALGQQAADIAQGVDGTQAAGDRREQGAGDQGMMFGYASDEVPAEVDAEVASLLMPAPIAYAHRLVRRQAELRRKDKDMAWLGPDAKSQVTLRYDDQGRPVAIDAVVLSTQHSAATKQQTIREAVMEKIIRAVLPAQWLHSDTVCHINPTGQFTSGGPIADCGLTGRKIIVDTYGGAARHGGGAFSGKDPSKVDRSAAYAARYVAKNIVAAGIARKCEVQVSYAIGVSGPVSIGANCFGTGALPDEKVAALIREHFDLRPWGLIEMLQLERPIYRPTSTYGHFGRTEESFSWERTDRAEDLRVAAGL